MRRIIQRRVVRPIAFASKPAPANVRRAGQDGGNQLIARHIPRQNRHSFELTSKSWTPILTFWVFSMGKYSIQFKITAIK
ncbi:hypothetical protein ACI2KS_29305, partial [Pseudomonas sp. NPDC087358]|uniref:hypothetical protein n=1 Tax=Pseudomonas sp. NPDC087358 TaxID=3364439 RepID=UPI00384AA27F